MRARLSRGKSRLVERLFGAYRRRILSLLLLHPEQSFYVREIGRLTGVSGLLTRTSAGNQIRYQADRACPLFEELAGVFRRTAGLADVLREALEPLGPAVRLAFVFGSVAQGKERPTSDVDVMVVGKAPFRPHRGGARSSARAAAAGSQSSGDGVGGFPFEAQGARSLRIACRARAEDLSRRGCP